MPRAKKPATKTDKKVVAKKIVKKEIEPKIDLEAIKEELKKELREELQGQIDESFLMWGAESDEEPEQADAFVDMDLLRAEISAEFKKEFDKKLAQLKSINAGETQALNLSNSLVDISATTDGITVKKAQSDDVVFTVTNNGALAFGNRSPRTTGFGTAHFRMKGAGKSPIPTNGPGSTRGLIVEGDGDDVDTFIFRALSTGNRQGFNVGSTGKVLLGTNDDPDNSLFTAYNNDYDVDGFNIINASKFNAGNILKLQHASDVSDAYNFIDAKNNCKEDINASMFRVNGAGETFTHKGFFSNSTGYAELFEWADGNPGDDDRSGLTVAVDVNGQLIDANDDNESIIGVVVESAAVIGNTGWNVWQDQNNFDKTDYTAYKVVEWKDESGVLHSEYVKSLSPSFALPEDAIIYETAEDGSDLKRPVLGRTYDADRSYTSRIKRGWALVVLKGTVNMYKGQNIRSSWIKIRDLNDELEQRILL